MTAERPAGRRGLWLLGHLLEGGGYDCGVTGGERGCYDSFVASWRAPDILKGQIEQGHSTFQFLVNS